MKASTALTPSSIDLNDGWVFHNPTGPFAMLTGETKPSMEVTLPHDAMRDTDRTPDAPLGAASGYYSSGAWTYERDLIAKPEWSGGWVALEIDGAASNARVFINGALAGARPNGYSRFWVEIGPYLRFDRPNSIRIEVRSHKDSRWYSGAGLYRGVKLHVAGEIHIAADGLVVSTPDVYQARAVVEVSTSVVNKSNLVKTIQLVTSLSDSSGVQIAAQATPVSLMPGQTIPVRQRIFLNDPELWSLESPNLYRATVTLNDGETHLHTRTSKFGIRQVRVDSSKGLRLNGVSLKLRGACVHLDNGPLGSVSHKSAELRRIKKLKDAGFNSIRISHNPAGQALLEACDEIGMLVINEAFDMWTHEKSEFDYALHFNEWWERDIESMVMGSVNHPSVIMYSIGNEILELGVASGANMNRLLTEKVRALDPTRLVTNGINTLLTIDLKAILGAAGGLNSFMGAAAQGGGDAKAPGSAIADGMNRIAKSSFVSSAIEEICATLDVTGYNYADARYEVDVEAYPDRVIFGSETFPTSIAANWELVNAYPQVIGDFTWTGWDYLGEAGIGGHAYAEDPTAKVGFGREFPYLAAYCGDIDITGHRRPASYYREIVFGLRSEPYIAVQRPNHYSHTRVAASAWAWSDSISSWSWSGYEDQPVKVEVYSDADEVELLVNNRSVGKCLVGVERAKMAVFDTVYEAGTILAIAYENGVESGRTQLVSALGETVMKLNAEVQETALLPNDLVYINISLTDGSGVLVPNKDMPVSLSLSGSAELVGYCSADPKTEERFDASTRTTFDGRALAVIRVRDSGEFAVTAQATGFDPQVLTINAR